MSHMTSIGGRGDTQEGEDTRKNVLEYANETGDAATRPMCHVGGIEGTKDDQGPSDECCRVYEFANFEGRHYDFCMYDVDTR